MELLQRLHCNEWTNVQKKVAFVQKSMNLVCKLNRTIIVLYMVYDFIVGKYVDEIWLEKKVKTHEHVFIDTSHLNKESKILWYKCLITIGKDIHD